MAVDMFLKLGKIKGESKDDKHGGEIDVLAWSWGASQSGSFGSGGGGGAGKANVQDLSVTKWIDASSASLLTHCVTGEHIPEALLTVRKAGKNPLEYLKIKLKKVLITSISTGGSGGEDRLTENISLNFGHVTFEYMIQKDDGTGEAGGTSTYDVEKNKQ